MTSKEFTIWLKGFITACNEYSPTPKQWDIIKEELENVKDDTSAPSFPFGTPNTTPYPLDTTPINPVIDPFPKWQYPHYVDPYNPYKVTCKGEETPTGTTITTTPGTGFVTIANPNLVSWGSGSITTNNPPFGFGVTSTAYGYPSGSAWHYTNGGNDIKD